jgi:putative nucleotidyltransferase with HDIG domain
MPKIPDIRKFISADRLKEILRRYSEVFKGAVFLLDKNKETILKFPEDASQSKLDIMPLNLRDSLLCYVAMPKGKTRKGHLDFIVQDLSGMVEMGYEIESLSGEVARNYEELSMLWKLSSSLGSGLDADKICNVLAGEVMNLCPSTNVSIMLVVDVPSTASAASALKRTGELKQQKFFLSKVSLGRDASRASTMIFSTETGLMGHVYNAKEAITVCDVTVDERFEGFPYPLTRILIVPMIVEDTVIGAIVATDKLDGEEFYSPEIKILTSIASECAISIKKALLYDEIREMLFSVAEAFSVAIDAKDPYTFGHSKRVSQTSVDIARELEIPPETRDWIRLAALLHDIGKIGVPDEILHGAGKLDPDAMEKMKEHPEIGAKMIEHVQRFRELALWISHHHEHYDGTGYPQGLKGEEIPFPSRIIAVADIFDALTSGRSYREAVTKEEAISILKETVGTHLDQVVFESFEKLVR